MPKLCLRFAAIIAYSRSQLSSESEDCSFHSDGSSARTKFDLKRGTSEIGDVCIDGLDGKIRCPRHCRQEVDSSGAVVPPYCVDLTKNLKPCRIGSLVTSTGEDTLNITSDVQFPNGNLPSSLPGFKLTSEAIANSAVKSNTSIMGEKPWLESPTWRPPDFSRASFCATGTCWDSEINSGFDQVFNSTDFTSSALQFSHRQVPTTVRLVASSPGRWESSEDCSTPNLWVFLYGQYRSLTVLEAVFKKLSSARQGLVSSFLQSLLKRAEFRWQQEVGNTTSMSWRNWLTLNRQPFKAKWPIRL